MYYAHNIRHGFSFSYIIMIMLIRDGNFSVAQKRQTIVCSLTLLQMESKYF